MSQGESRYGIAQPQIEIRLPKDTSHRLVRAALHRLAAEVELATPEREGWRVACIFGLRAREVPCEGYSRNARENGRTLGHTSNQLGRGRRAGLARRARSRSMSSAKRTTTKKPTRARAEKAASPLAELSLGEDSTRQFKRDVTNSDALAAEMAAFANSEGGKILLGVADDGRRQGSRPPT